MLRQQSSSLPSIPFADYAKSKSWAAIKKFSRMNYVDSLTDGTRESVNKQLANAVMVFVLEYLSDSQNYQQYPTYIRMLVWIACTLDANLKEKFIALESQYPQLIQQYTRKDLTDLLFKSEEKESSNSSQFKELKRFLIRLIILCYVPQAIQDPETLKLKDPGFAAKNDLVMFLFAAEAHSIDALFCLNAIWANQSTKKNELALRFTKLLGAASADMDVQFYVGLAYLNGTGVQQDRAQAIKYFQMAAVQGHILSEFYVAFCFEKGYGVGKNSHQAKKGYEQVAKQGYAAAQYLLAVKLHVGNDIEKRRAMAALEQAVLQGHIESIYLLGFIYFNGEGVVRDYQKAALYFAKASISGDARAQYFLGLCCRDGLGVTKDDAATAATIQWLTRSAKNGFADAQYELGVCFQSGRCTPKDPIQAKYWYEQATAQNHIKAIRLLAQWYEEDEDEKQAYTYYKKAGELGDEECLSYAKEFEDKISTVNIVPSPSHKKKKKRKKKVSPQPANLSGRENNRSPSDSEASSISSEQETPPTASQQDQPSDLPQLISSARVGEAPVIKERKYDHSAEINEAKEKAMAKNANYLVEGVRVNLSATEILFSLFFKTLKADFFMAGSVIIDKLRSQFNIATPTTVHNKDFLTSISRQTLLEELSKLRLPSLNFYPVDINGMVRFVYQDEIYHVVCERNLRDLAQEAKERDLVPLYCNGDGQVYDPTGKGISSLKQGVMLARGNAEEILRNDILCGLRWINCKISQGLQYGEIEEALKKFAEILSTKAFEKNDYEEFFNQLRNYFLDGNANRYLQELIDFRVLPIICGIKEEMPPPYFVWLHEFFTQQDQVCKSNGYLENFKQDIFLQFILALLVFSYVVQQKKCDVTVEQLQNFINSNPWFKYYFLQNQQTAESIFNRVAEIMSSLALRPNQFDSDGEEKQQAESVTNEDPNIIWLENLKVWEQNYLAYKKYNVFALPPPSYHHYVNILNNLVLLSEKLHDLPRAIHYLHALIAVLRNNHYQTLQQIEKNQSMLIDRLHFYYSHVSRFGHFFHAAPQAAVPVAEASPAVAQQVSSVQEQIAPLP